MKGTGTLVTFAVGALAGSLVVLLTQENTREQLSTFFKVEEEKPEEIVPTAEAYKAKEVPNLDTVIDGKRYRTQDAVIACEGPGSPMFWTWLMKTSRRGTLFVVGSPMVPFAQTLIDPNIGNIFTVEQDAALDLYYKATVRHLPFEEVFPDVAVTEA